MEWGAEVALPAAPADTAAPRARGSGRELPERAATAARCPRHAGRQRGCILGPRRRRGAGDARTPQVAARAVGSCPGGGSSPSSLLSAVWAAAAVSCRGGWRCRAGCRARLPARCLRSRQREVAAPSRASAASSGSAAPARSPPPAGSLQQQQQQQQRRRCLLVPVARYFPAERSGVTVPRSSELLAEWMCSIPTEQGCPQRAPLGIPTALTSFSLPGCNAAEGAAQGRAHPYPTPPHPPELAVCQRCASAVATSAPPQRGEVCSEAVVPTAVPGAAVTQGCRGDTESSECKRGGKIKRVPGGAGKKEKRGKLHGYG